jgi:site-specific recombinase XerD
VAAPTLDRTIDDYLAFLRVERGLADATLTAYRSDLADYQRVVPEGRSWAPTPHTAVA